MGELLLMVAAVAMSVYGIHLIRMARGRANAKSVRRATATMCRQTSGGDGLRVTGAWFAALAFHEFLEKR
jgi:hypothetical protein